jgi:hypothetical protein
MRMLSKHVASFASSLMPSRKKRKLAEKPPLPDADIIAVQYFSGLPLIARTHVSLDTPHYTVFVRCHARPLTPPSELQDIHADLRSLQALKDGPKKLFVAASKNSLQNSRLHFKQATLSRTCCYVLARRCHSGYFKDAACLLSCWLSQLGSICGRLA